MWSQMMILVASGGQVFVFLCSLLPILHNQDHWIDLLELMMGDYDSNPEWLPSTDAKCITRVAP